MRLQARQDGRCGYCNMAIGENDTIISKKYGHKSKYFHKTCAEKINIL